MYSVNVGVITSIFTAEENRQVYVVCVFVTNLVFKFLIRGKNVEIEI